MGTAILYASITAAYALYLLQTDLKQKAGKIIVDKEYGSVKLIRLGICLISFLWPYLLLRRGWRKVRQQTHLWFALKQ